MTHDAAIVEQIAYYRSRATEYEEWYRREGRYYRGEEHRRRFCLELNTVKKALTACHPGPDVLELACGTGYWTRLLAGEQTRVTAVDAAPEMLALNRRRLGGGDVDYIEADLFEWRPAHSYGFVFFGFWLSHVPAERFDAFWEMVSDAAGEHGRVFFVDSLLSEESGAVDHQTPDRYGTSTRRLNDGRVYRIVKIFYEPDSLTARLHSLGWTGEVKSTGSFFLYGCFRPAAA